jgi:hypothetical protein
VVTGIIVAGYGGGALIFDQVSTAFVDPSNISPQEINEDDDGMFACCYFLINPPLSCLQ